jgi:hypothetical protein
MPVLKRSIGIDSDDYIFGNCLTLSRSPPQLSGWHGLFHVLVESVGLFSCEDVVDLYSAVIAALSNILVVGIESNTESLIFKGSKSVLG